MLYFNCKICQWIYISLVQWHHISIRPSQITSITIVCWAACTKQICGVFYQSYWLGHNNIMVPLIMLLLRHPIWFKDPVLKMSDVKTKSSVLLALCGKLHSNSQLPLRKDQWCGQQCNVMTSSCYQNRYKILEFKNLGEWMPIFLFNLDPFLWRQIYST